MKINSRFTKVAVAAGLVVATGAGVLGLTGFASAQMANSNRTVVTVADNNTNGANGDTVDGLGNPETVPMHSGEGGHGPDGEGGHGPDGEGGHGPDGEGGHGPDGKGGHGPQKFATAQLATTLKLTEVELQTQLKSGKTIKQIADAQNVDIADVKTTLTADFKAHLDEEVASGEHTQAEADAKLAEFNTRLDDMVNASGLPMHGGKGGHGPEGKGGHGGRGHGGRHGDMPGAPAQGSASQGA
jgi:DNA-binding CsgD family transcriptional regulator